MKIYYIDYNYINYLRKYDNTVLFKDYRPYVGVLQQNNGKNYFLPLTSTNFQSSLKENGKSKFNPLTMVSLRNGDLGTIKINTAIPVNVENCKLYDINSTMDVDKKKKLIKISRELRKVKVQEEIENKFIALTSENNNDYKMRKARQFCCKWNTLDKCSDMFEIIKGNDDIYNKLINDEIEIIKDNPTKLIDKVNDEIIDLENLDYDNEYEEDDYDM